MSLIAYYCRYKQPPPRPDMIDKKVIDGHVIPGHVIFTSPAQLEHPYSTEAFEDNLKVTATFFTQNDGKQTKSKATKRRLMLDFILTNFIRSVRQVEHCRRWLEAYSRRCVSWNRDGKHSSEERRRSSHSSSFDGCWYDCCQVPRGM